MPTDKILLLLSNVMTNLISLTGFQYDFMVAYIKSGLNFWTTSWVRICLSVLAIHDAALPS